MKLSSHYRIKTRSHPITTSPRHAFDYSLHFRSKFIESVSVCGKDKRKLFIFSFVCETKMWRALWDAAGAASLLSQTIGKRQWTWRGIQSVATYTSIYVTIQQFAARTKARCKTYTRLKPLCQFTDFLLGLHVPLCHHSWCFPSQIRAVSRLRMDFYIMHQTANYCFLYVNVAQRIRTDQTPNILRKVWLRYVTITQLFLYCFIIYVFT